MDEWQSLKLNIYILIDINGMKHDNKNRWSNCKWENVWKR